MFLLAARSDLQELREESWTGERRVIRAVHRAGLRTNHGDTMVDTVRRMAVEYRVERTVSAFARIDVGRPLTREGANQLHRITRDVVRLDVDSETNESEEPESSDEGSTASD